MIEIAVLFFTDTYIKSAFQRFLEPCARCGSHLLADSFSAHRFLTLLGLPIFWFGKVRVMRRCYVCKSKTELPLKQWLRLLAETRAQASGALDSEEAAADFCSALVATQDTETFLAWQDRLGRVLSSTPAQLAKLGQAYKYFGLRDQAERCLVSAYSGGEREVAPLELARLRLENGELEQAEELIEGELGAGRATILPAALYLVECWQAEGKNQQSLALIDHCLEEFPGAVGARWKSRRSASACRDEGSTYGEAPAPPAILPQPGKAPGVPTSTYRVPAAILAFLVLAFVVASIGARYLRPVYLGSVSSPRESLFSVGEGFTPSRVGRG